MPLNTLQDLIDANPDDLAASEFVGTWDLFHSRNAAIEVQSQLQRLDLGYVRELTEALKKRFPFDYTVALTKTGDARITAIAAAFNGPASPTPFLPVVLFALAVDGVAGALNDDELAMLAGYAVAAVAKLSKDERNASGVAGLLRDICRVLRDSGQYELAEAIATQAVLQAERLSVPVVPLSELFDALYDARSDRVDRDASISDADRPAITKRMLAFIDEELTPAIRAANRQLERIPKARRTIEESELALQHRRLSWETAAAMVRSNWPVDATERWLRLAGSYAAVGSNINEAGALSCALDDLALLVARGAPYSSELEAVLSEYLKTFGKQPWRSQAHRRDLLRRAVAAELALGKKPTSNLLDAAYQSLELELRDAGKIQREFILSNADDDLGVLLRTTGPDDVRFKALFKLLRGAPLPAPLKRDHLAVLRFFTTRLGSAIQASTPAGLRLVRGEQSHELARTLSAVALLAQRDINEWSEKKIVPLSASAWKASLAQLEGRTGLTQLGRTQASPPTRVLVELDGLGVHLPVAGPLLNVWNDVEAVALTRLGFADTPAPLASTQGSLVLSGFTRDEPWDQTLQALAAYLRVPIQRFETPAALQASLTTAKSLVVVGAHGLQDGVAGELRLQIGEKRVPVEEAIGDVRLPVGATVVCATCFAGSGQGTAMHGWRSMPEWLLRAGARAVVANRWPAWADPATQSDFFSYLLQLRGASVAASAWEVVELTTAFMKRLRAKFDDPRHWAGWGAWLASTTLLEGTEAKRD